MDKNEEVTIWVVEWRAQRQFYTVKRNAEKRVAMEKKWDERFPNYNSNVKMYELTGILKEV